MTVIVSIEYQLHLISQGQEKEQAMHTKTQHTLHSCTTPYLILFLSHFFLLGITIGMEAPRLTVNEGSRTVKVCARPTNGVTLERIVTFTLSTEDNEATSEDPRDFVAMINSPLKVDMSQSRDCADVTIEDDGIVEDAESFRVVLSSSNPKVDIGNSSSTVVLIEDNDKVVIDLDKSRYLGDGKDSFEVCGILRNATLEKTLSTQFFVGDEGWFNSDCCQITVISAH